MPVCARVGRVEQLHDAQVHLAGPEREADPVLEPEVAVGESREQFVLERIDRRIRVAEHTGVVGVRGDTLEAVYGGLLEGLDVLVAAMVGEDPDSLTLRHELLDCGGRLERDSRVIGGHDATRCFYLGAQRRVHLRATSDDASDVRSVEVDVRDGREERAVHELISHVIADAHSRSRDRDGRDPLQLVQQEVLQHRHLGRLAADADGRAAYAFVRLFTLVTEHVRLSFSSWRPTRRISHGIS